MEILILDQLIEQTKSTHTVPQDIIQRIRQEYQRLADVESQGHGSLQSYLINQNGKQLRGAEHIFKYRLSKGDRILYTYGKYIPCIREEKKDALVLIGYTNHDEQGYMGKSFDFKKKRSYVTVGEILDSMDANETSALRTEGFSDEDVYAIAELISEPNYMREHIIYVVPDDVMESLSPEKMDRYLSSEQDACITSYLRSPQPTLIHGGAGTGKTLIAIHMLDDFNRSQENQRGVYFTQSQELRLRVEGMYDIIKADHQKNEIAFEDINDFCLSKMKLERTNFVQTKQFMDFLHSRPYLMDLCAKNRLGEMDVWTEIRGTIKGAMSKEWTHTKPMSQQDFPDGIESLVEKGYFVRNQENKQLFTLYASTDEVIARKQKDQSLSPVERDYLDKAIHYFNHFDPKIRTLSKEQYLGLSEEDTMLSIEARHTVWDICQQYEDYLRAKKKYDENDLVRMMFQQCSGTIPKFDFMVIDEVQDYTELQIFLLREMCISSAGMIFAGDGNQIINPTMFRESRLQMLFRNGTGGTDLRLVHLTQNFRCQKEIVDSANRLCELRRKAIGSKSIESEQPENALRNGISPFRLQYSEQNARDIFLEVLKYPRTVILTADEQGKREVIQIIGEQEYLAAGVPCVFTVSEIKGMEYSYVVCFDLISHYASEWEKMLYDGETSHKTKYRYYFNLLYVAMTRAQDYLCFVDKITVEALEQCLGLQNEKHFDSDVLQFTRLSNLYSDWIEQAREFEMAGKYEEALAVYQKAHADDEDIYRCEMNLAIQNHNFERVVQYGILNGEAKELSKYIYEPMSPLAKELGTLYVSLTEENNIPNGYHSSYNELVDQVYCSFDSEAILRAKRIIQAAYVKTLFSLVESISKIADGIK